MTDTTTRFDADTGILTTRLVGTVSVDDVQAWIDGLHGAVDALRPGTTFALLLDLHGYESATLDAHRRMRTVIPQLLANHGLRPAYIDLFDERPHLDIEAAPRVRCIGFANVHHNADRMDSYQQRAGNAEQRFFSDRDLARTWLANLVA